LLDLSLADRWDPQAPSLPIGATQDSAESSDVAAAARTAALRSRAGLLAACLLALAMGSVGITNEGDVSLHGDMPKHLMNGAYVLDLVRDHPFTSFQHFDEYTRLYYARYPALSLGHHPPLLAVGEAPAYAILGVSVAAGRAVMLLSFIAAVAFLYLLVHEMYGTRVAVFAGAFLATSPFAIVMTRSVFSEMPALALVVASAYYLRRFCASERRGALVAFVITAILSLYAKQLAIFVFPAFGLMAVTSLGFRRLFKRDVMIAVAAIGLAAAPLTVLTLVLSRNNVAVAMRSLDGTHGGPSPFSILYSAVQPQFAWPVLLLAGLAAARALGERDRRPLLFLFWLGSVLPWVLVVGRDEPARYSIYWVPAICALAATIAADWRRRIETMAIVAVMLIALGVQASAGARSNLVRAEGYEEAARFVLQANPGPTVLFSGDVDTGFFPFFIRKHDAARRLVVLRADKVLTTSFMDQSSVEDRIERPDEIYGVLRKFGTRYVVVEDRPSQSRVLTWLQEELRSSNFIERKRIPIGTSDARLRGTSLAVYEFTGATPPDKDAILSMQMPLVAQSVSVRLSDLIARKHLR